MPRYVFSNGKVTVEDGLYLPVLRDDKPKRRGVVILASPSSNQEPEESKQEKEQSHVE
jgi:hypothetical protein